MTLLAHRAPRRRAAFTLIELMVVMAILTLMLTLLMSGVQRVRIAAKRNSAHTEIYQLGQSIAAFKQKFNVDYIPSRIVLKENGVYGSSDPIQNKLEMDSKNWLLTAWPHMVDPSDPSPTNKRLLPVDWNQRNGIETGAAGTHTLEGDQCLVFFLGGINENGQPSGFSVNKTNPMANTAERLGPFFQFPAERLTNYRGNGFRSFIDPWNAQPYLYFTSYGKQAGYKATESVVVGVSPYVDPKTGKGMLMDGFQIICAGEDKLFGPGGTNLPATGTGEDDIANFNQGTLGSAS